MFGSSQKPTWIIAFLGNPGPKYAKTRHNAGFMAADRAETLYGVRIDRIKFKALTAVATVGGERVLLMKPQTYMNLSGEAVGEAAGFYKIPPEHVLVVSDEMHLPAGDLRIRRKGSAGGHNGLKNIIAHLGTEEFPRIRIGVGAPAGGGDGDEVIDWVIGSIPREDLKRIEDAAARAAEACACYIQYGAERAMNQFNQTLSR
ncbi:MAG: aminoacyl-tRNA hydrolase [Oscillospiraceae bacterium]|nr:aminoacyl-tRNA hydrolase [Oscillospiraceae bacterium]MDY4105140.1 aminoacyl-tRNA hydrolase [Oscillospiraceae bacterium]